MDPTFWSALVLVGGGVFLAVAALYAVRTAAKWPEIVGRLTQVEVLASEAYAAATKAKRIAGARASRKRRAEPTAEDEAPEPSAHGRGGRVFTPGAGVDGRMKLVRPSGRNAGGKPPHPVGFADEE